MKTILYVHPSTGLYGADKALLWLVSGLDKSIFKPIVLLPDEGPLYSALKAAGVETRVVRLTILGRALLNPGGIAQLPLNLLSSMRAMNKALQGVRIDIVHSNTVAVISGAFWAKLKRISHVWHVHEIIVHPTLARQLFPLLVWMFARTVVCNSTATRNALLRSQPLLDKKSVVIWNGTECPEQSNKPDALIFRQRLGVPADTILVVLAGRINRLKGQGILVDAANLLCEKGLKIHYLIVGSPPHGQDHFQHKLVAQIAASPAREHITLMDFSDDIWTIWGACDIAVVPSTEPESFGLVALEAMVAGKPVIAANHGGVTDLVVHNENGLLVEPGNANELADAIMVLVRNPVLREVMGKRGRAIQEEKFSLKSFIQGFTELYGALLEK